jgi:DNA-binding protein H-NS
MAKKSQSLAAMSVDALLKMRDDIGSTLSKKMGELQRQLASLTGSSAKVPKRGRPKGHSLKGRKVAPKYKGPNGVAWAGRGATPRWMVEAIKGGAKKEDFLIAGVSGGIKKTAGRKSKKRKAA